MVWKAINQAVADGDIPAFETSAGSGVTLGADSHLVVSNGGDPTFYVNWMLTWPGAAFPIGTPPRIRITAISYSAEPAYHEGWLYQPSSWEGADAGGVSTFYNNLAPPGAEGPVTPGLTVDAFVPSPLEFRAIYSPDGGEPTWHFTYATGDSFDPGGGSFEPFFEQANFLVEIWVEDGPPTTSYNCACDDENNNETLGQLRNKMMHLLGWGATAADPPPGVAQMLTFWLQDAQAMLYRRFTQLRTERFFSWPLQQGVRMYDLPENQETCTKRLDPRKLTWVGTERDGVWLPLISSIPPELYSYQTTGRPVRYEIRQCIEVWPTPDATNGNLIIKGHFGLERFTEDTDKTTIDSLPVFQVALANAKAHYRQPDANNYIQQMEALIRDLTAGLHGTRRYIPGRRADEDYVYVEPRPTMPFPTS